MRGVHLFMLIVALPALAALSFDLYLFYMNQDQGFMLSTPGYVWTHYEPGSYRWAVENLQEYWPYINFVLAQKSVYVGGAFAGFFYVILFILNILRLWPFNAERGTVYATGNSSRTSEILGKKTGSFKYKRK